MEFEKEFLTEKDIESLGIRAASTQRNDRWAGKSLIPYVKIGKSIRYRSEDVRDFIRKNTIKDIRR